MGMYQRDRTARVLATNLRHLKKKSNLSQVKFAAKCGMTPQMLKLWQDASAIPRLTSLQKVASSFGLTVRQLLTAKDDILMPYEWLQFNLHEILNADNQYSDTQLVANKVTSYDKLYQYLLAREPLQYSSAKRLADYVNLTVTAAESELPKEVREQYHLENYYVHLLKFEQARKANEPDTSEDDV